TRILLAGDLFGFGHHTTALAPGFARLVEELSEYTGGSPGALLLFLGLVHLFSDFSTQALIPCETENVVHRVFFAPRHQLFAAEPGVRSQDDLRMRPGFPNLGDDPLHFLEASSTRIDVGRPQPGTQQLVATENVQRQITVVVVVAMKEARFLLPMQWGVRGIQIQNDVARRLAMGLQKQRDQQFVYGYGRVGDLVVAFRSGRTYRRQLQPVQRAFAGQRFREIALSGQYT